MFAKFWSDVLDTKICGVFLQASDLI